MAVPAVLPARHWMVLPRLNWSLCRSRFVMDVTSVTMVNRFFAIFCSCAGALSCGASDEGALKGSPGANVQETSNCVSQRPGNRNMPLKSIDRGLPEWSNAKS
jgi:hypothetical protein